MEMIDMAKRPICRACGHRMARSLAGLGRHEVCPIDERREAARVKAEARQIVEAGERARTRKEHRAAVLRGDLLA